MSLNASPTRLGRYEIVGLLATGGMAEVFLGRFMGPSGFERVVVIKRILPHLAREPAFVDMFLDEARIVAKINHPNVIQVSELGRDANELFLAMEFVEGESLGGFMRRHWSNGREIGTELAAFVVSEVCAGLHAAHELTDEDGRPQEVVHRDVSPQNVMITYGGQVKVLDFGIAKAVDRSTHTKTGHLKGKVEYMSPEQCRALPLDRRSDVFALGVILFELATGKRLFRRRGELEALRAVCDEPIPSPLALIPGFPPALDEICMRALSRSPEDRFASADEMRKALLAYLRSTPNVGMHDETLGSRMKELFADRLETKNTMLRKLRAGSPISGLPEPEVDLGVEVPLVATLVDAARSVAIDVPPPSAAPSSFVPPAPAPRKLWPAALLVGATAIATAAGWVALRSGSAAPTIEPSTATSAPPPGDAPTPAKVSISITTTPNGARIIMGTEEKGVTPTKLSLDKGEVPLELELHLDGFATHTERIIPNVDQRLTLALSPAPVPQGSTAPLASPVRRVAPSVPSASAGRYRKFN